MPTGSRCAALSILLVTGALAAPEVGFAQASAETRPALFGRLTDCRKLADNTARLACYDRVTGDLERAEAQGDIVVVDREQARKVRSQAFGFAMPSLSLFERGEAREALETVTGRLAAARKDGNGKWTVRLEDGAVWTQIDSAIVMFQPRPGMEVKVRRAALGSYMLSINGRAGFRARRVE